MPDKSPTMLYCYHCATYHPESEMRLVPSKTIPRWRCIKSIEAAKKSQAKRDAFGREVSAQNSRAAASKIAATNSDRRS
jgi:hypothetical protein